MEAISELQIDGTRARVTKWSLAPGAETGPHRHEFDYVVVPITSGQLQFVDPTGTLGTADLESGSAYERTAGIEHNVSNPGDSEVVFVEVEMK